MNADELITHVDWLQTALLQHHYDFEITKKTDSFMEVVVNNAGNLVLHFATHPQPSLSEKTIHGSIIVDSLEDIAVNKVTCLFSRDESKDVFDLYWILQNTRFEFDYLIQRAKEKTGDFDDEMNVLNTVSKLIC